MNEYGAKEKTNVKTLVNCIRLYDRNDQCNVDKSFDFSFE